MTESHTKTPFVIEKFTCYAGRAIEKKKRLDREAAENAKRPEGWDDGLHYYARPIDPTRDTEPKEATWRNAPSSSA